MGQSAPARRRDEPAIGVRAVRATGAATCHRVVVTVAVAAAAITARPLWSLFCSGQAAAVTD